MKLHPGDVVLIRVRFHESPGSKIRPAVVVLDTGDDDFVGAPITSKDRDSDFDLAITHWQAAGLNVPSVARIHKLGVLSKANLLRRLKQLSREDSRQFSQLLCRTYCSTNRIGSPK
jgi:mRNA interferase MazF